MRLKYIIYFLIFLFIPASSIQSHAEVDWGIYKTLNMEAPPLDLAVSLNGKWIFVLSDQGDLLIFSSVGKLEDKIKIGNHVDQIEVGPREEIVLLKSKKNKTIQILALGFVKDINVSGSPMKGSENAPVTIIVFSDFQCKYCKKLGPLLDQVLEVYPEDIKIVFKNFPLKQSRFSSKAAVAALAAYKQGAFWEFHDRLFENSETLNDQKIQEIASDLGLDQEKFEKELDNPNILSMIQMDFKDAQKAGVRSVPAVFINGRLLKNRSLEGFQMLIDNELKKIGNGP